MAKVGLTPAIGSLSGTLGNVVFVRTNVGTVMRSRPTRNKTRTPAQTQASRNLALANQAWRTLSEAEFEAWKAYAQSLAAQDPATGNLVIPKAVNLFIALSTKFLQINPGLAIPPMPPTEVFLGDLVRFSLSVDSGNLSVTASQPNAPFTTTEILTQSLRALHNTPRPKSYASALIHSFKPGDLTQKVKNEPGVYAVVARFVNTQTGESTGLMMLGKKAIP